MRFLRQSTAVDLPVGPFLSSSDGTTAMTALSITQPDIRIKKNGAAWAQKNAAQTLTHEENGNYEVSLDATDTNALGLLRLHIAESGALPVWEDFMVMPANVWDSLFGNDRLQVDNFEWNGTPVATPAVAGVPQVNLSHVGGAVLNPALAQIGANAAALSGDTVAADNAEAFFDGTGYAGTNNVIPTVTTVTNQVTANMTAISGDTTAADNLEAEYDGTGYKSYLRRGTAQAGGASTMTLDAGASASNDFYNGLIVAIMAGTGAGQAAIISDYVGSTKVATINGTWVTQPTSSSVFQLFAFGSVPGATAPTAAEVADEVETRTIAAVTVVNGLAANTITATAIQDGAVTNAKLADGVLTAAKLASNAITAAKLDPDVTTELQTGLATSASIAALNDISAADVNAQVVDVLATDTHAEIGQENPPATTSYGYMLRWLYKLARNPKRTNSNTNERELMNDAGSVVDQQSSLTSAGGVTTAGKWTTGP